MTRKRIVRLRPDAIALPDGACDYAAVEGAPLDHLAAFQKGYELGQDLINAAMSEITGQQEEVLGLTDQINAAAAKVTGPERLKTWENNQ